MLDLSTAPQDVLTSEVEITHPLTGKGLGAFLMLAGPEHPDRKRLEWARSKRLREELAESGTIAPLHPDEEREEQLDLLCTCVLGWRGFTETPSVTVEGQLPGPVEVPFSKDKLREVLGRQGLAWMRMQVQMKLASRDVFISASVPA